MVSSQRPAGTVSLPLRLGVSSCLLGHEVRYDGTDRRDTYVTEVLSRVFDLVPTCPEVEIGLGIPRETIHLVGSIESPRLLGTESYADHTAKMNRFARQRVEELLALGPSGYVFKKGSPSCGPRNVPVQLSDSKKTDRKGQGVFAAALVNRCPLLPVEDELRLQAMEVREGFVMRVFAYARMRQVFGRHLRSADLVAFHSREKLFLMAHSGSAYKHLGRLVADVGPRISKAVASRYQSAFMKSLERGATVRRHVNALQHAAGYFKKVATQKERGQLNDALLQVQDGALPMTAAIVLVARLAELYDIEYLQNQTYLNPDPRELFLRSHA